MTPSFQQGLLAPRENQTPAHRAGKDRPGRPCGLGSDRDTWRSFHALEHKVDVFVYSFLVGERLRTDLLPACAESKGLAIELVDGLLRRDLELFVSSSAHGELPVHVLGPLGRIDGDCARR